MDMDDGGGYLFGGGRGSAAPPMQGRELTG